MSPVTLTLSSCSYHVGGTASELPPAQKSHRSCPRLKNDTLGYRIEQRMTEAVIREFIAHTAYRVVSSEQSADAVLHGEITSFEAIPAAGLDNTTFAGRPRTATTADVR